MCSATNEQVSPAKVIQNHIQYTDAELAEHFNFYERKKQVRENIRACYDATTLKQLRQKLWGTEYTSMRRLAEIHREKAKYISQAYTPPKKVCEINTLDNSNPNINQWVELFETNTVSELKKIAAYVQSKKEEINCTRYRILQGMIFYKTGDEDIFIDAYNLNNRGAGISVEKQTDRLSFTFEQLDPILGSLLFGYIQKITTNEKDSTNSLGSSKNDGRWINLISDTKADGISTVSHEIGHSIQYAFGINCDSNIDNRDATNKYEKDFSVQCTDLKFATTFQTEAKFIWNKFIENKIPSVREYQNKNFNEFFACAFEYWVFDESTSEYKAFFNKYLTKTKNITESNY